ncbi:MAG: hypothetical protein LBE74_06820 [Treponema sp.]|jgi:hypothetical protein|nr:hypothetical protein [Treponema sp.]
MTTGIIVAVLLGVLLASHIMAFAWGRKNGIVEERLLREQAGMQKIQAERDWNKEKEKIMEDVFGDAEKKKADLSVGDSGRARFDRINASLREPPAGDAS